MANNESIKSTSDGLLTGKIALIVGASRGIGASAAHLFAAEGASVVLASRNEAELAAVAEQIRENGGTADHVVLDLADSASVRDAVDTVVGRHGRLDVAFNNAGVAVSITSLADLAEEEFDLNASINFKGIWLALAAEVRAIRATSGVGAIVNTSSIGSTKGNPGLGAYGAAKRAINSLTQTAAVEYGPEGVRVNAITPGTTMTDMIQQWVEVEPAILEQHAARTPLRRAGQPEEVAEAAAWLLSDRASYITGAIVPVDGGMAA